MMKLAHGITFTTLFLFGCVEGFVQPTSLGGAFFSKKTERKKTLLHWKQPLENLEISYGEQSRRYRRDFFNHDKWLKHRAPNRFLRNLGNFFKSGVVRSLAKETLLVSLIAVFITSWNLGLVTGYEDFSGVHQDPFFDVDLPLLKLPLEPFTLSSPALSLLLVFRTNASYRRWDEARKAWGVIVNNSRTILRQTSVWLQQADIPAEEKQRLMMRVADAVWLFPRAERRHLLSEREDELSYMADVRRRLAPALAEEIIQFKRHRPSRALYELTNAINEMPIEFFRRVSIDESVSNLCDAMGGCDRIYGSPVPAVYTRHTARFLELWLIGLPLALWQPMNGSYNHLLVIPVSAMISFFLLGIEELAIQLEEPFSVLPLQQIAAGIGKSADEHVEWLNEVLERQGYLRSSKPLL